MEKVKNLYSSNLMLIASMVKGATAVVSSSLILSENHPYWTLFSLAVGAIVTEYLLKAERNKNKVV
jgi:hypothetical protein